MVIRNCSKSELLMLKWLHALALKVYQSPEPAHEILFQIQHTERNLGTQKPKNCRIALFYFDGAKTGAGAFMSHCLDTIKPTLPNPNESITFTHKNETFIFHFLLLQFHTKHLNKKWIACRRAEFLSTLSIFISCWIFKHAFVVYISPRLQSCLLSR